MADLPDADDVAATLTMTQAVELSTQRSTYKPDHFYTLGLCGPEFYPPGSHYNPRGPGWAFHRSAFGDAVLSAYRERAKSNGSTDTDTTKGAG